MGCFFLLIGDSGCGDGDFKSTGDCDFWKIISVIGDLGCRDSDFPFTFRDVISKSSNQNDYRLRVQIHDTQNFSLAPSALAN